MEYKNRHIHSILVHPVIAFALMASLSRYCYVNNISFLMMRNKEWYFLELFSLFLLFIISIPATLSGVFEISKMYARWHNSHKIKLILSLSLILLSCFRLIILFLGDVSAFLNVSIYSLLIVIVFFLSYYGLKITLGRQSLGKTSYEPDFFKKNAPVDILKEAEVYVMEKPKRVDIFDLGEE